MLPRDTSRARRVLSVFAVIVLVLGIFAGGGLLWASKKIDPSGPQGEEVQKVVVPKGASTASIGKLLADKDIISSSRIFTYYVGWKNAGPWKAGEYVDFRKSSSFDEAIEVLAAGPIAAASKVVRVTEGLRLSDALKEIESQMGTVTVAQLQQALESGQVRSSYKPAEAGWEGFLFPDTYEFDEKDSAPVVLQKMAAKMDSVLDELSYDKAEQLSGRSAYELVTIASLIEKETGQPPEERGKISRVISNRLDEGEPLGIDASVLYGLGRASGGLTKSDLAEETPYNTRKVAGLPPTPIALAGKASLEAAIEPTPGDWKYYVLTSNEPPTHFFTSSYKEFTREKANAQERGVF